MMFNPNKMMEAWLNLITEAARGSNEAREVIKSITGTSLRPDEVVRMMTHFMPAGVGPISADTINESLEEYWKMMGVVPRYRYLELLERYEELRIKLEEKERSMRMQPMLDVSPKPEETKKVLDLWGAMLQQTLQAQQEMMQAVAAPLKKQQDSSSE